MKLSFSVELLWLDRVAIQERVKNETFVMV